MVDPGTALLIASAVSAAAKGAGDYISNQQGKKAAKLRAKETKRETEANILQDALQRSAEREANHLQSRNKMSKSRANSMQNTADLLRGAFNI